MVDAVLKFYTVRYAIHTRRYEQVKHPTATQGRKAYERHLGIHGRMTIELMCDNPRSEMVMLHTQHEYTTYIRCQHDALH